MHSHSNLILCLAALATVLVALPIPTTTPQLKVKFTQLGLNKVAQLVYPQLVQLQNVDTAVEFELDGKHFTGTFRPIHSPTAEIVAIDNDATVPDFSGYDSVDSDDSDDSHDRRKRSVGGGSAKVLWEDEDFLRGKNLGALKVTLNGLDITLDLHHNEEHFVVTATGVDLIVTSYLGTDEGQLRLARIAAELDGSVKITKDGVEKELDQEKRDELFNKFLGLIVKRYQKEFNKEVTQFKNIIGSKHLPKFLFDFRLTEDPSIKDGALEISLVGKFVFDKDLTTTYSNIDELDSVMENFGMLKLFFRQGEEPEVKPNRYEREFVLFESNSTPNTDELATEGSDAEEETRKQKGAVVIRVGEDFINSFFATLVQTGYTDLAFSAEQLKGIVTLYQSSTGSYEANPLEFLPEESTFEVKLLPVEGDKFLSLRDHTVTEQFGVRLGFNTLHADYTFHAETKVLFRNGKIANDYIKVTAHKTADTGYPELLNEETLKGAFEEYTKSLLGTVDNDSLKHLTEFTVADGAITVGLSKDLFD